MSAEQSHRPLDAASTARRVRTSYQSVFQRDAEVIDGEHGTARQVTTSFAMSSARSLRGSAASQPNATQVRDLIPNPVPRRVHRLAAAASGRTLAWTLRNHRLKSTQRNRLVSSKGVVRQDRRIHRLLRRVRQIEAARYRLEHAHNSFIVCINLFGKCSGAEKANTSSTLESGQGLVGEVYEFVGWRCDVHRDESLYAPVVGSSWASFGKRLRTIRIHCGTRLQWCEALAISSGRYAEFFCPWMRAISRGSSDTRVTIQCGSSIKSMMCAILPSSSKGVVRLAVGEPSEPELMKRP